MGARLSEEMKKARKLLRNGMSPAEAARQTGLTAGAISQDPVCREIVAANKLKAKERK